MKYLIIDDNENIRQLIRQTIGSQDDIFKECADGEYAAEVYKSFLPDFVFMDIQMHKTDGLEATRNILKKFPMAKIIITTDLNTPSFQKAAEKAGALALVSKENLLKLKDYLNLFSKHKLGGNL